MGLTQTQVADMSNISERSYQNYEYGKRIPNAETAIRLAKVLNVTVDELFTEVHHNPM